MKAERVTPEKITLFVNNNAREVLVRNLHAIPKNRIANFGVFNDTAVPNRHIRTDLRILDNHILANVAGLDNFGTFEVGRI